MSRRHKSQPRSRVEVISEPEPQRKDPKNRSWYKIYEAADRADFKGWFFLPTLQPAEQANSLNRRAITERLTYLYKNVGALSMAIDGLAAEEAGTGLWPKWSSSSPEYNTAITDRYHYAVHDPRFFSGDGETDGYTAQFNIRRMIRLYGDCFGQMLRPAPGRTLPLMHMIAGWRVDSSPGITTVDSAAFRDGIARDPLGRATAYAVQGNEYSQFSSVMDIVPASQMLHFHDPFLPGETRGVSCLASVVKKMFRREDILKACQNGTLARERLGFALQTKDDGSSMPGLPDIGGEGEMDTLTQPDGTKLNVMRLFGDDADEKISIPKLPMGAEIKTIESNRPGTAVTEFLDLMLREVAWSTLYPPEYLFFLGGLGQGTVARLVLQRVSALVRMRRSQQLIPQFCNRWHTFWAWQAIKNGILGDIQAPADWWKHRVLADADKSVDLGREGRLLDDRVATGKMSIDRYHSLEGEDTEDVENENLAVISRRLGKLKDLNKANGTAFVYHDMWPPSVQNPQVKLQGNPLPEDE